MLLRCVRGAGGGAGAEWEVVPAAYTERREKHPAMRSSWWRRSPQSSSSGVIRGAPGRLPGAVCLCTCCLLRMFWAVLGTHSPPHCSPSPHTALS